MFAFVSFIESIHSYLFWRGKNVSISLFTVSRRQFVIHIVFGFVVVFVDTSLKIDFTRLFMILFLS